MSARTACTLAILAGSCGLISTSQALAGGCTPSTGPDVIVGDMPGIANYSVAAGMDAFTVATTSCNIGSVNLQWVQNSPNHPVIPQNMYRYRNPVGSYSRMEQVGQGWMKHGFTALTQNLCCTCSGQGGAVLGIGCSDPYSATRNGTQCTMTGGLGPRFQVNAHSGAFIWPYAFQNNCAYIPHTSTTRRVQVAVGDLDATLNPGSTFYIESQYVTPDDATALNQNNNASYRQMTMSGAGDFTGNVTSSTQREKPAIRVWKISDPSVVEVDLATPEATNAGGDTTGLAILSADATDLGGGVWHYEYALYNMNSDRSFSSFSVPSSPGLVVTNIGFRDVQYHSGDGFNSSAVTPVNFDGTDWAQVSNGSVVSWTMIPATPLGNSNALRWGTMYNFRFDANSPPTTGSITLGLFKAVVSQPDFMLSNGTVVPLGLEPCPADVDGNSNVDIADLLAVIAAWGTNNAAADVNNDGTVNITDLLAVIAAWGKCA